MLVGFVTRLPHHHRRLPPSSSHRHVAMPRFAFRDAQSGQRRVLDLSATVSVQQLRQCLLESFGASALTFVDASGLPLALPDDAAAALAYFKCVVMSLCTEARRV